MAVCSLQHECPMQFRTHTLFVCFLALSQLILGDDAFSKTRVETCPSMDFDLEAARSRICNWPLPCFKPSSTFEERRLKISHIVDSDSVLMVCLSLTKTHTHMPSERELKAHFVAQSCQIRCLGALLKYLEKNRVRSRVSGAP